MQRSARTNLVLAALAAALGALAWWQVEREVAAWEPPLADVDAEAVERIRVRCTSCVPREFARGATGWRMTAPYALDADPLAIARLLAVPASPVRLREPADVFEPAKIGLDPPLMTLELDALRIDIGTTDALRGDRYVRDGGRIAMVPDRFSPFLMATPESELDRHLLPRGTQVTRLRIDGADASAKIAAWSALQATRILSADPSVVAAPAHVVECGLADGGAIAWQLVRTADGWVARRATPTLDYHLDARAVDAFITADAEP